MSYYDDIIHEADFVPDLSFRSLGGEVSPIYLGIELEVGDMEYEDVMLDTAQWVLDEASGFIYLKYDCSIPYYGFEVVSHPGSIGYHRYFQWEMILKYMANEGLLSHDASSECGLHIHINRSALPSSKWIIVDWFINRYRDFWINIARRECNSYARFKEYSDFECKGLKGRFGKAWDKFESVNFCHEDTVEFRIFRGSLRYKTFIGTLELTHAVVAWAKEVKVHSILHEGAVKSFTDFVKDRGYTFAVEYLQYRHLL